MARCGPNEFLDVWLKKCLHCKLGCPELYALRVCEQWCTSAVTVRPVGTDWTVWGPVIAVSLATVLAVLVVILLVKRCRRPDYRRDRAGDANQALKGTNSVFDDAESGLHGPAGGSETSLYATVSLGNLSFTVDIRRTEYVSASSHVLSSHHLQASRDGPHTTCFTEPYMPALQQLSLRRNELCGVLIRRITIFDNGWDIYVDMAESPIDDTLKSKISEIITMPTSKIRILPHDDTNPGQDLAFQHEDRTSKKQRNHRANVI